MPGEGSSPLSELLGAGRNLDDPWLASAGAFRPLGDAPAEPGPAGCAELQVATAQAAAPRWGVPIRPHCAAECRASSLRRAQGLRRRVAQLEAEKTDAATKAWMLQRLLDAVQVWGRATL